MQYDSEKRGEKIVVYNTETGGVCGTFPDTPDGRKRAQRQLNLLRAIDHGWEPTGKRARK